MNTKSISRHISKKNFEQDDIIEEEYRSIMRIVEVLARTSSGTVRGDLMFYGNETH